MRTLAAILSFTILLGGCAMSPSLQKLEDAETSPIVQVSPIQQRLEDVPKIDGSKITIAVYSFTDKTGQRKPSDGIAKLSSAVTQGGEVWVIKALQDVGSEGWFEVVERVGMDNLLKERQLIRQTRDQYEGKESLQLKPLLFAGLILEGGIIGYDSNVAVGGLGARWMGIGANTQYRIDTVTISLRIVSVSTGKVLLSIATEKTIASHQSGADIFRFLDMGTKLIETETGFSVNEPVNYATRAAIEQAVVELVYEGENKGLWKFQQEGSYEVEDVNTADSGSNDNVDSTSDSQ
jgi:curli production assembly/transport component CsgG